MNVVPVDAEYIKETDEWFECMHVIGSKIDRLYAIRQWAVEIINLSSEYVSLQSEATFPNTSEGYFLKRQAEQRKREVDRKVSDMFARARRELPHDAKANFGTVKLDEGPAEQHLCSLLMQVLFWLESEWCKLTKQEPMELRTWKE